MRARMVVLPVIAVAWLGAAQRAAAETAVEVLDTFPSASTVTLGRNQNYYLRIGYRSDEPVRIWVQPYFRGQPVQAGTNPSALHSGSGEMLGWFFMMRPGDEVDEIRVRAGDGSADGTRPVASHRVRIVAGSAPAARVAEPEWVADLERRAAEARQADYEKRMNEPVTGGTWLFTAGFALVVLGVGAAGIVAPVRAMRRWHGGWRVAAALPLILVALVVLRILIDVARDPTSHNLWPFEILQVAGLSVAIMLVLLAARKITGATR